MDSSRSNARLPGAERTGSRTRIRQSALYADRPRRSRHRRSARNLEHSSDVSSSELEVTNPATFEALSVRDSTMFPSEIEEHPIEVGSSELGQAVTDLPRLEALSLMSELPLLTPEETSEESDDEDHEDVDEELIDLPIIETLSENDTGAPLEVSEDYNELPGVYSCGQTFLLFNQPKGLSLSMVLGADSHFITVSDDEEEQTKPDSDVDSDEFQREMEEYLAARPCINLWETSGRTLASEHATPAHTAEWGTEPPSVIAQPAAEVQQQQETGSLQAPQQAPAAATQRHEASTEDIVRKGKTWMCEEVMLCFKKYLERSADFAGLEYKLDELCHQCFNVESYNKVFHHYNFKVMMKVPSSVDWILELYFAEVKQILGRKYYFCCPLEPDEDGDCYACKNQGVEDLKHPSTGGFDMGSPGAKYSLW
ncbi:hypothetical protein EJB05_26195 [Eragrostis curvula]|uniref:DUF3615 domain-containing protein n=1 Tax=Eragrostis curvula TaxID=38414 RepID=A0A5J9UJ57_9POAL|nr:hypothetical protein EJB05_26195 [Eragrostis curvula]